MSLAFRGSATLVLPGSSQEPLWVPNAEDFVAVVWNGGRSFFVATPGSFSPSHNMFYFVLRVSHTMEGVWYVWTPVRYQDRIRVNGQVVDPHLQMIGDGDVISVRPPKPREETLSISFFLPSSFLDDYTPRETLRCGVVSRTYACRPTTTQINPHSNLAVKVVRASRFANTRSFETRIQRERAIVDFLRNRGGHPHVIHFHDVYHFSASAYFVTERFDRYLDDVLNKLRKQSIRLAMWEVRGYVWGIISATLFLHSVGIVLRNISTKNICLCGGIPKLSDFTAAGILPLDVEGVTGLVNPVDHVYLAPEVLQGAVGQSRKVDSWSIGMVLKALLLGLPVVRGFREYELRAANLSELTIDVVRRLLRENPQDRRSIATILEHPWFAG